MKLSVKAVVVCIVLLAVICLLLCRITRVCDENGLKLPNIPPKNPFLADSANAVGHYDPSQQDSSGLPGPTGPTQALGPDQINYQFLGPAYLPASISSPYNENRTGHYEAIQALENIYKEIKEVCGKGNEISDKWRIQYEEILRDSKKRRVVWSNGPGGIVMFDHDTQKVLARFELPGGASWTNEKAEAAIKQLETLEGEALVKYAIGLMAQMFKGLSGIYTMIDKNGNYYLSGKTGLTVYGDAVKGDPDSAIAVKGTWDLPEDITGNLIGMNMSYDGWIILATEHGYVIALSRDLKTYHTVKMAHSEGAAHYTAQRVAQGHTSGQGWVRNGYAVDDKGGIYIVSLNHVHKVVWTGKALSIDPKDGAWSAPYLNGLGFGSGATTSLMGFDDEDKFVVITDGEELMNVVLLWRDEIPGEWKQLPGAPSRRIAGMLPAHMGGLKAIQSEQSVVVAGYGAAVVNNEPASMPPGFPERYRRLFVSILGAHQEYTPKGVHKFEWDPEARKLKEAWVNTEVSSPNAVPFVSIWSNMFYTIGTRDGKWTLEGLDWATGESVFHWIIGGERYNSLFSGVSLDWDGRIVYTGPFGKVALEP